MKRSFNFRTKSLADRKKESIFHDWESVDEELLEEEGYDEAYDEEEYNEAYEEEYAEENARAYILKALNKYAKANGIMPTYILVDVSW